jgi:MFS family permease
MTLATTTTPTDHDRPPRAERNLWGHANFLRLWAAQAVSAFGSRITRTALPIIAVDLGQPESIFGVLGAMQLVPGIALAMVAGGVVDRGHKRRILIAADAIRAALVASLTVAWAFGALAMSQVVLVGAGVGAATALFQITDVAYLPQLVGKRRLAEGNARLETTEAIAEITGPASAGLLIAALGAPLAVVIDAASYVWSAVLLGRIRGDDRPEPAVQLEPPMRPERADAPSDGEIEPDAAPLRTGEDFRIGVRAVFGHPVVRPIILTLMIWSVSGGFFTALYTPFCLRTIGLSKQAFGVIIAMGGVGSLGGAMIARGLMRRLGVGRTLLVTSTLSLSCTLFIPIAAGCASRAAAIGFLAAHQLFGDGLAVAFVIVSVTVRQTSLPREVLGRASAAIYVATTSMLVITSLIAGGLASLIGIRAAVWIGMLIGLTAPLLLWPVRRVRDMPSGDLGPGPTRTPAAEPPT